MKVAIVYNKPENDRYQDMGEGKAIAGVLDEVDAVYKALGELGYNTSLVSLSPPLEEVRSVLSNLQVDVVFNLFEGFAGCPETEAALAAILSALSIPYTGCPPHVLSLDKAKTKELLGAAGIRVPGFQLLTPNNASQFKLNYPCIVKPAGEHASHGLTEESVVRDFTSLEKQVRRTSLLFGGRALVEEYLDGREFNTAVLGNGRLTSLSVTEIVFSLPPHLPKILTYAAKWEEESPYFQGTRPSCPADITEELRKEITSIARKVFKLVGCHGYARVDYRLDSQGKPRVLEFNPNPDITPGAGVALQAEKAGIGYNQFIERIVQLALEIGKRGAQ